MSLPVSSVFVLSSVDSGPRDALITHSKNLSNSLIDQYLQIKLSYNVTVIATIFLRLLCRNCHNMSPSYDHRYVVYSSILS
jgi:hypothetical protein